MMTADRHKPSEESIIAVTPGVEAIFGAKSNRGAGRRRRPAKNRSGRVAAFPFVDNISSPAAASPNWSPSPSGRPRTARRPASKFFRARLRPTPPRRRRPCRSGPCPRRPPRNRVSGPERPSPRKIRRRRRPASPGGNPSATTPRAGRTAPMAAKSDRLTARAFQPKSAPEVQRRSNWTPSTSMSVVIAQAFVPGPPRKTAASSPGPTRNRRSRAPGRRGSRRLNSPHSPRSPTFRKDPWKTEGSRLRRVRRRDADGAQVPEGGLSLRRVRGGKPPVAAARRQTSATEGALTCPMRAATSPVKTSPIPPVAMPGWPVLFT